MHSKHLKSRSMERGISGNSRVIVIVVAVKMRLQIGKGIGGSRWEADLATAKKLKSMLR